MPRRDIGKLDCGTGINVPLSCCHASGSLLSLTELLRESVCQREQVGSAEDRPRGALLLACGSLDSNHGHHPREGHDAEQALVPSEGPFCSLGQVYSNDICPCGCHYSGPRMPCTRTLAFLVAVLSVEVAVAPMSFLSPLRLFTWRLKMGYWTEQLVTPLWPWSDYLSCSPS